MYNDVTGIILTVEKNEKITKDIRIKEHAVIEHIKNLMTSIFERVILITNNAKDYKFLELEMFEEFYKNSGPLSAIHAGLFHTETQKNFILSSEFPLVPAELIKYLVDFKTTKNITLTKAEGNVYELAGVYSRKCFLTAEDLLKKQVHQNKTENKNEHVKVVRLIDSIGAQLIAAETLPFYSPNIFYSLEDVKNYSSNK